MATKKSTAKPKAEKAKVESTAPVVELPKGTGTQDDAPPPSSPEPIPRGKEDREPKERKEDTLRLPEDKARWEYGTANGDEVTTMLAEQREINRQIAEGDAKK